jgi:transcriptional regulator with XRE-family HTH domain
MKTPNTKKFAYNAEPIASERRRRNIKQGEMATKIGYSRQQVNRAEKGVGASFVLLQRMCNALDVPLSEVIPDLSVPA